MAEKKEVASADNVEILTKEVIEEAEAEVEELIRRSENRSIRMIEDVKKKLEAEVKRMFEGINEKIKKERETKIADIKALIKKDILEAKEEILNSVISRIEKKLQEFTKTSKYKLFLKEIFQKMLSYLHSEGTYRVYLHKDDMKTFTQSTIEKIQKNPDLHFIITQKAHIEEHGILITSEDRKIILEDTIEKRFNQKKDIIRNKIAKDLFER